MILVDSKEDKLFIEGEFKDVLNECATVVDYCSCYYVNDEFNRGVPLDEAKEKLREFLNKAVESLLDNVEILPEDNPNHYTS